MKEYAKTPLNKVVRGAKRATYDKAKVDSILDAGFMGYVSYIYEGIPISLPMVYGRIGDKIYLHGSLKNRMLLSLLKLGKVSMTVMHLDALVLARSGLHHSANYRSVTIFGPLKEVTDKDQKVKALKYVINGMVPDRWDSLRPINDKEINSTLVAELTIEIASAKIRNVGVADEKADYDTDVWAGLIPVKQVVGQAIRDEALPAEIETPEHVLAYVREFGGS